MYKSNDSIANVKKVNQNSVNDTLSNGILKNVPQPKMTSTPMHRRASTPVRNLHMLATPPKPKLMSPRKYSLSEIATPPRGLNSSRRDKSFVSNQVGPLLCTTPFNVNVSTYLDAKSPGLASRLVQYNEEAEKQHPPTHQAKYGSPGLFPVVHLFKKDLPKRSLAPKRVTVRIASPEYSRHNSPEYNRLLLEGIVRPKTHGLAMPGHSNESTRSVLDALKEISRKRIHASEEYDLIPDSGKRQKKSTVDKDTNKRFRGDSPETDAVTSPNSKQMPKRLCVYDEYAASRSSMDFSFMKDKETPKSKRKISKSPPLPAKESKQIKLISVETQTAEDATAKEKPSTISTEEKSTDTHDKIDSTVESKPEEKKYEEVKIFTETSLDRVRKNRLSALMGTLTNHDPIVVPKPPTLAALEEESADETDKSPTNNSILKPLGQTAQKSDKHVTFQLPESSTAESTVSTESNSVINATSSIPTFSFASNKSTSSKLVTPTPTTSPVMFGKQSEDNPKETQSTTVSNNEFKLPSSTSSNNFTFTPISSVNTSSTAVPAPVTASNMTFSFGSSTASSTTSTTVPIKPTITNSPPKTGGFHFDLSKPTSTPSVTSVTTTTSTFSSTNSFSGTNTVTSSTGLSFGTTKIPTTVTSAPTFNFGAKSNTESPKTAPLPFSTPSALATTTTTSSTTSLTSSFKFGSTSTSSAEKTTPNFAATSATPTFTFSSSSSSAFASTNFGTSNLNTVTTTTVSNPVFAATFGTTSVTTAESNASNKPIFAFGTNSPSTSITTSTNSPSFGTPISSASIFTSKSTFGGSTTPAFGGGGTTNASSTSSFVPVVTTAPSFGASSPFATQFNQTANQTPAFGATTTNSSVPSFANPSTLSSTFKSPSTGGFGGENKPAFGSTSNVFSTTNNNQNSAFNPAPKPSIFGQGGTNSSPFNSNSAAATATTTTGFGSTSTTGSVFGTANAFAVKTTANSFGTSSIFGSATTTTAAPSFGSTSTTSAFGGGNFGSSATNNPPAFNPSSTFGANANPTSNFGTNQPANAFGANSGFGGTSANAGSVFGAPAQSNTAAASPFDAKPNNFQSNTFGNGSFNFTGGATANSPANSFSTSNTFGNNSFGQNQATASAFGAPAAPLSTTTQSSAVFNFNGNVPAAAAKPAGVFTFGSVGETPKPSFNFSGAAAPPAFGATAAAPNFGAAAGASAFQAPGVQQFNAPTAGSFSIGAGPPSQPKPRSFIKGKRRT